MEIKWDKLSNLTSGGGVFSRLASYLHAKFVNSFIGRIIKKHQFLRNQRRIGIATSHTKWRAYTTGVTVFTSAFFIAFLASSIFTPINNSNADTDSTDNTTADGYSLTLSATAAVDLDLTVGPIDVMTVGIGMVNVKTNSPGYKLFIGMTGNTSTLNGNSTNIPATSGTITAPTSLTRGTWGYAVPSNTDNLVANGFSSSYSEMASSLPNASYRFAIPPTSANNPDLLADATTATTSTGDNYPIYYGVRANMATAEGSYTNNVMFTAVADANTTEIMDLTPDYARINTATTITAKTSLYATSAATADFYLLTSAQNTQVQGGTAVETLGLTPLTCTKTSDTPMTYSCNIPAMSSGTYYIHAKSVKYDKAYTTAFYVKPTLTVNPNGGTWSGSASTQTVSQMENTSKTIDNPTGQSFTISYDMGTTGISQPSSPTSATKPFASWTKDGGGTLSGTTYTFGNTDGSLTANYNDASITLPSLSKVGHTCKWAEGSSSGTEYTAGTVRTITANTTYYAKCSVNSYTVNISNSNTTSGSASISVPYGGSTTVTVTPASGYYLSGVSCPSGYTCTGYNTGTSYTGQQTVTVTNSNTTSGGTLTFTGTLAAPKFFTATKMQDFATANDFCSSATTPNVGATGEDTTGAYNGNKNYVPTVTLLDDRKDGTANTKYSYKVKKLADGKCWMTENLKLTNVTLSSSDSNLPTGTTFNLPASSTARWCTTSNSTNCDGTANVIDSSDSSYGTYYNWFAATAGEGTYSKSSDSVSRSICPKGWRLPTGGSSGEFQGLYNAGYNTASLMKKTTGGPAFVLSGYRNGSSTSGRNNTGYYWSSTANNNSTAYVLRLDSNLYPAMNNNKYRGNTVRCVAQ